MKWIFIFLIIPGQCIAQDPPPVVQQQLEEYAEVNEKEELEDDNHLQQLQYFRKHPINLNNADKEDLDALLFLNSLQVFHLLEYRRILGKLIDLYELQAVPGFDPGTIQKILPYIIVESTENLGSGIVHSLKESRQQLILRWSRTLERSRGYNRDLNGHFLGDGNQVYLRYNRQSKYVQFGFTAEKDKGEQFFKGAQSGGFDFYSFHFFIKNHKKLKALALGDYVVNLGQGLIHWQSMGNGKGMQVLNAKRETPMLLPYRSAGEFNFMRGAAIHYKLKNVEVMGFSSYRYLSASVSDSAEKFSAFNASGLHRTQNEIEDRNKIGFFASGIAIQFLSPVIKLGLHTVYYRATKKLEKNDQPHNRFIQMGGDLYYFGIDYSKTYKNFHFFGELAMDKRKNLALSHGMLLSMDAKVDLAIQYRKIDKGYQSLFGNAFTENNMTGNESGLFAGIILKPAKGLAIHAFTDFFTFPWLRYRVDAPSKGSDHFIALEYQPTRLSSFLAIFRSRTKAINGVADNFEFPFLHFRQSLRFQFSREINKVFQFRSRFDLVSYSKENELAESGSMIYIEGISRNKKTQFSLRLQWFDTESYNSRIYSYEPDVLFSSSIISVSDKGFRYFINSKFDLTKEISFSARIAQSIFNNKSTIGSGFNEISGKKNTDLKLQVLYSF